MLRTRARRAAARVIVSRPAYRAFTRLRPTALLVARAAFRTGRDDVLESTLDRLARRGPAAPPAPVQVLRTDLRTFQGRYEEALREAESAARAHPSSAAVAARVVTLGYRVRERADAERAAVAAVERFPLNNEVMWQVALACDNPEQYERVRGAWATHAAEPDLPRVVRQLGVAAARAGQMEGAMAWYRSAITLVRDSEQVPAGPGPTRLAGLGAHHAIRDLRDALDAAAVPFFFAAGTALGLVREGGPLGADGDIDVGIFDADWDRDKLIALFREHPLFDLDLHPQTQKIGLRHRGGSPVDIFRFYQQDGRVWHDGVFVRWHNSPFQVERRQIGAVSVPLPADADRYLSENYGDWRTPWPGFDAFTSDAPNLVVTWPEYQRMHLIRRGYQALAAGDRTAAARELRLAGEDALAASLTTGPE